MKKLARTALIAGFALALLQAQAGRCCRPMHQGRRLGTGALEGFASFMAEAAMKNSAKAKLGDGVKIGTVSKKCEVKTLLYECTRTRRKPASSAERGRASRLTRALPEAAPAREARAPPRHVGRGAGVAEAHVAAAALGIEVDAGRGGDADVGQHLLGEARRCRP